MIRRILRSEPRILRSEVGAGSGSDHRINLSRIRITDPDLNFRSSRSRIRIRILRYGSDPDPDPDLTVLVVDPEILKNPYACAVFPREKIISFRKSKKDECTGYPWKFQKSVRKKKSHPQKTPQKQMGARWLPSLGN